MGACRLPGAEDTDVDVPVDTEVADTGEPWEFVDTGGADTIDDVPLDVLTIREWGMLTMTPIGGPYTSLAGELRVQEYLNGLRPPEDTADTSAPPVVLECDVVFTLSGVPDSTPCAGCDFVFRVDFALISGSPDLCHDPELPRHQSQWPVAWNGTEGQVVREWGGSGLWMFWFDGQMASDVVSFEWEVDVGVSVEEEEE